MTLALVPLDVGVLLAEPARISIVAQPIVDLVRQRVVGYEALSRFQLDSPMSPDKVFAEASRRGVGEELEAKVITRALEISKRTPLDCFFTINVDPIHLESDAVRRVVYDHGDLRGIVFELTEHREIQDWRSLSKSLDELKKRGALVAVDDAGSGYSGLKQLLEIRPQILKLDRELVTEVHTDEAKRALVQMLGELSGRLDAWLLAEGIETAEELNALQQMGVPLGQGYFLARPMPPWTGLLPAAAGALASSAKKIVHRRTVESIVEPAITCRLEEAWPKRGLSICVTSEGRPLKMRMADGSGERFRAAHELLFVKKETGLAAIAKRIAARPDVVRWDPVVCIGDDGTYVGVVRPQRLLCALAEAEDFDVAAMLAASSTH